MLLGYGRLAGTAVVMDYIGLEELRKHTAGNWTRRAKWVVTERKRLYKYLDQFKQQARWHWVFSLLSTKPKLTSIVCVAKTWYRISSSRPDSRTLLLSKNYWKPTDLHCCTGSHLSLLSGTCSLYWIHSLLHSLSLLVIFSKNYIVQLF